MELPKKLPNLKVFPWTPWQKELNKDGVKGHVSSWDTGAFPQRHPIGERAAIKERVSPEEYFFWSSLKQNK